ncbi:hypothetical protein ELI_09715 [Erythrobacter litoralis HTCC2594]|uniref:Uncharacterized protein n=2 Tax=Erythrobacter litoralis TaxID=39960 RepID=Q2N8F6_ERYLH|nr:hypothetical protein ELI_09715 [Erythrobacter litoralis HTCC2594]
MLWLAAAYNFAIGAAGLFAADAAVQDRAVSLLVFSFGVLYAMVAIQPLRLAPALWAGVFGKIGIVGMLMPGALAGEGPEGLLLILVGDVMFTAGFLAFLLGPARRYDGIGEDG